MASIRTRTRRDGTTVHSVLFRTPSADGVLRQTSESFDSSADAVEFQRLVERHGAEAARRILKARDGAGDMPMTVVELVTKHIGQLAGVTDGTRRKYNAVRDVLDDHPLGALPAKGASRADVAGWVRDMEKAGLSGKTISFRHQLLAAAYKRAVLDEELTRNPATGVKMPRTEQRAMEFLTPDEFMVVYATVPKDWRPLILTLASTGLRIGEALALRIGDLHLTGARPRIDVRRTWQWTGTSAVRRTGAPKTERGRRAISIGGALVGVLTDHTKGRPGDAWVFPAPGGTEPPNPNVVSGRWRRWVKASGIAKMPRLHDLRHTHVAWMLDEGMPLDRIKQRLGHASIKVTVDTYGHILPDALEEMGAASDRALAGRLAQIEA